MLVSNLWQATKGKYRGSLVDNAADSFLGIHTICSVEKKLEEVKKNTDEKKKTTLKLN